jgi:hypothetical protein
MKTITKYAIRHRCPDNLARAYFGSRKTRVWVCGLSISIEQTSDFGNAVLFNNSEYIKQHDMTDAEIVDVIVNVPE